MFHGDITTSSLQKGNWSPTTKSRPEQPHQLATGKLRIHQRPGPDEYLGLINFNISNKYSVYLHDAPNWERFFSKPERAVTHGCVHLEDTAALAAWLSGWPVERVESHAL